MERLKILKRHIMSKTKLKARHPRIIMDLKKIFGSAMEVNKTVLKKVARVIKMIMQSTQTLKRINAK